MRGFGAFLGKELREIVRTWRIWVLPGIVLLLALSGPILAKLTPDLIKSMSDSGGLGGAVINLPDPTWRDAYAQWTKNISQIVIWALVIILGGMVSAERRSGTAILVLTKPVSRPAFILAKFASNAVFLTVTTVVGAVATWGVTYAVFAEAPIRVLAGATGVWLVFALFVTAVMTLVSALIDSQSGAAGLGFGMLVLLSIATLWGPAVKYSPAGLMSAPNAVLLGTEVSLAWPLATGALAIVLLVGGAVLAFGRKEL
ncbi:MAG: hypothetical protein CVT59_01620 [Actinobacteria bacterium HGW-Actinobacteria-1]|jgi:ABC-2 type transport system permease protein|nr:MAG: hypothetical protein CVT59_01620 [Actinobacteria bacterium HGW-Actinobacteria-1]